MKIRFLGSEIREYSTGNLHYVNDGSEIDVLPALGTELLAAEHFLDGEFVKVFEEVSSEQRAASSGKESGKKKGPK